MELWSSSKMTECKNLTSLKRSLLLHERRNWMEMENLSGRHRERKAERMKAVAEFIFVNLKKKKVVLLAWSNKAQ